MNLKRIRRLIPVVSCFAILAVLSNCGSSTSGSGASCTTLANCTDYTGSMWTTQVVQMNCSQIPNSTFSESPCSTENRVGSCVSNQGGPGETILRFYPPHFTASTAETTCTSSGGTWIP